MKIKNILLDYIDACEVVNETEEDIRKLCKRETVHDKVSGSNPDFPYQPQNFSLTGMIESDINNIELKKEQKLLWQRIESAQSIKVQAEEMISSAPIRIQRIIRYKVFHHMTWGEVALKMGEGKSGDAHRKELNSYFQKK